MTVLIVGDSYLVPTAPPGQIKMTPRGDVVKFEWHVYKLGRLGDTSVPAPPVSSMTVPVEALRMLVESYDRAHVTE